MGWVVGMQACRKRCGSELVFKDEDGTCESNDDDVEREKDTDPQVNLEEGTTKKQLARTVNEAVKERTSPGPESGFVLCLCHFAVCVSYQFRMRVSESIWCSRSENMCGSRG